MHHPATEYIQTKEILWDTYLHINNGGVIFAIGITGDRVASLQISSNHFGNLTHMSDFPISKADLAKLGEMLTKASQHPFQETERALSLAPKANEINHSHVEKSVFDV